MSDRDLLEAAAKAAGIELVRWNDGTEPYSSGLGFILKTNRLWNPLEDDGDALRLAVQCGITITPKDASLADIRRAIVNMAAYESNKHDSRNPRSPNKTC